MSVPITDIDLPTLKALAEEHGLLAVALEGYYFNNWSGIELSEDLKNVPSLNFNVKSKLDIIANFIKINYVQTKSVVGTVYRPGNVWFTAGGMTTDRADLISIDSDGAAVVEIPYYENEADSWAVQFNNLLTGFDGQAEGQRFELTFDAKWESDIDSDEATISIWSGLRFTQDGIYNGDFQWADDNKDLIFDNGLEFSDSDNSTRKVKKNEWTPITWGGTIGSTGAGTIGVQINLVDGKNQNNYGKFRFKNVTVKFGKGTVAKYFYQPVDNLCKITAPDNVDTKGLVYGLGYYQKGDEVKLWSGATGGDYVFKGWTTDGTNIIEGATEPTYTFRASGNLAIWPMFEPITVHSSYYLGTWADRITNEWFVDASFNNYGVNENDEAYYMFDAPEQNPWNAQFCAIFKNLPNQEVGKEFSLEFEAKWVPLYDTVKRNAASIQMVTGKMLYYNESSCYQWTENNTELVNAEGKFDESVRSIVTKVGRDWTTINWNGYIGNYGANEETDEESPYYGEGGVVGIQMNMIDTNKIVTDGNSGTFYFRNIVVKMGGEVVAEYFTTRSSFIIRGQAENGEIQGVGEYARGTEVPLTAVPADGYQFVRWSDGYTSQERTITADNDYTFGAVFCDANLTLYTVTLTAEGREGATVTGSGRYYSGETVVIKAEPVESFVEWNDGDKTNPRVITGITDIELTASFAQTEEIPIDNVVNYDDNNDWYLSGFCDWGEHIVYNGEAKVEFHAELGNNSEGESIAKSWNAQFCNIITGLDGQEQDNEFMLVFDAKWVPDESTTRESAKIWLLTGKKKDYQWNIGNSELLSQSGGTNDNVHNFQTSVGRDWTTIAWGGIIGAEGVNQIGVQINLIDESVEDHNNGVFWFRNVKLLINGNVVREYFTKPQEQSRVSAFASFGTVSGLGYYANGASATLQVNPYEGYTFRGWNDDATATNPRTITVSGDTYLFTSLFDAPDAQVVVTTNSTISQVEINGTVTTVPTPAKENGSNIYTINCHRGDKVQIVVSEIGKAFFGWVDDTQKTVCEAASYTFKVDNDETALTAMFEETIEVTLGGLRYEITDKTAQTCQLVQAYSDEVSGAVTIRDKVTIGGAEYTVTSIAGNAFAYNNNLTSVTIPEGVTSIGGLAFSNCSSMTSLSIPSTIEFIGDNAFEGCNLQYSNDGYAEYLGNGDKNYVLVNYTGSSEEPVIDANCKFIYQKAFEYNSSIKTLTVPGSVKGIGYQAFHGCSQLQSATVEDGVTYIAEKAFDDCPQLTTVSIPNSIENMEQDVFWSCHNLKYKEYGNAKYLGNSENQYLCLANASSDITSCQIHEACRFILNNAFESCSSLTEINIPNAIEYIGNYAFNGCSGLVNVTIPETIKYIGYLAFNNVVNINYNGNYGEAEETWGAVVRNGVIDGKFVYSSADTDKTILLRYIGKDAEVTIPNSVTFIGHGAFSSCTNLTNVTITDNVSRIGEYAFEGCTGIKSLDVPSSVTSIGDYAFNGVGNINYNGDCGSETDTWGAQTRNATVVGDFIYQDADKKILLKYVGNDSEVVVPGSVTDISANAFKGSKEMTKITIPASVENIGENAFSDCWNLETAEFASIEQMCSLNYAGNAESWEEIYSNPLSRAHNLFVNGVKITELEIPSGVESISPQAFYGGNFTSVSIPSSVKSIGAAAFKNCNQLATVTIAEGVETIDNFAFNGCGFAQFRIPNTVTSIGNYAFGGCSNLNTVYIPSSVETMGGYVFDSYNNICSQYPSIPAGWDSYWCYGTPIWGAVTDNNGIVYAQTEDGSGNARVVGYIGEAVNSLEIPASIVMGGNTCSVTAIRSRAFCNSKVISIDVPESVVSIDYDAFGDSDANRKVVNINYSGSYGEGNDTGGALYRNYAVDGDFVYTDATKTSILRYVGKNETVTIPNGVTTIGENAFQQTNVKSVTIRASVTTINQYAFDHCENLQTVVFEGSSQLTYVGYCAFYYCNNLKTIEIPNGVETIESYAFTGVINLIYTGFADGGNNNWGAVVRNGTVDGDFIYADAAKTQLVKYTGNGGEVTIPTTVTSIGESAFYNCGSLTSVSIVASVKNIGSSAFNNCNGLKTVTLAEGVENIADYAFSNCYVLENITIPTTIKTVGSNVFLDCENLNGTTSDNVIYLGTQANPYTLLLKATSTEIASYEINTNCKIIYQNAFMGCYNLKSLDVPDGVINIGEDAFSGVKNINYTGPADAGNAEEKWGAEYRNAIVVGDFIYKNNSQKTIVKYIGNESEVDIPIGVDTIGTSAFQDNTALISVAFLESVTTIEESAFYGCSNLASVSFATGSKLASVGAYAFYDCNEALFETDSYGVIYLKNGTNNRFVLVDLDAPSFVSYEIPQNCQVICQDAFSYYTDLESVSFASGSQLVGIGENAFSNCSGLTGITIPSSVETIENNAFSNCFDLATVTFADGSKLASIGDGAFERSAIQTITIPSSVTAIGDEAFVSCGSLATVSFASGSKLASIGKEAFYNCGLTEITIPSSVTNISKEAFRNCSSLATVTFAGSLLDSIGEAAFAQTAVQSIEIPSSIISIGKDAFYYCNNLATVTFAGSLLASIGESAFTRCALTAITIPSSVTTIGKEAFNGCSLQTISFAVNSKLSSIGENAFCENNLTEVNIPNGVTTIGNEAFIRCSSLQKAIIPASVTTMGANVFCNSAEGFTAYCAATEKPTTGWSDSWDNKDYFGNKIEVVWNSDGTTGFKYDLHTGDNNTATVSRYIPELGSNDVNVVIPSEVTIDEVKYSVTAIAGDAFASCRQVSSVFIPASVTTMGSGVFTNMGDGWGKIYCEATTPDGSWSQNWWCDMEVVFGSDGDAGFSFEYYDDYAAITHHTGEQTSVVIPTMVIERGEDKTPLTITEIRGGDYTYGFATSSEPNTHLTTVTIPSTVKTIGRSAFRNCSALATIDLSNIETIGDNAFYNCSALTSVTIPSSVETIGQYAFYNCSAISWVTIPASVATIDNYAFYGCSGATINCGAPSKPAGWNEYWYGAETPTIVWGYKGENVDGVLYNVSGSSVTVTGYSDDTPSEVAIPGLVTIRGTEYQVTSIGQEAFQMCSSITSVTIPVSVTSIGGGAFWQCNSLTSVTFTSESSVASIDYSAFAYTGLTSITIPNSVTSIGDWAFEGCSSLTSVTFTPESSVTSIGGRAFEGCTGLTSITIPESVTRIDAVAFSGCTGLTSITILNSVTSIGSGAFEDCSNLTTINFRGTEDQKNHILENLPEDDVLRSGTIVWNCNYTGD